MTNYYYTPDPTPKVKRSGPKTLMIVLACLLVVCCSGAIVAAALNGKGDDSHALITPEATFSAAGTPKPTPAPRRSLRAADLVLKVKIKSKECFGSAGCNVQWTIDASMPSDVRVNGPCEVTYEVRGLTDPQTQTLTIQSDGVYEQDGFQFGQTSSSGKKLTAKATDVRC